jgi:hypothetical protein
LDGGLGGSIGRFGCGKKGLDVQFLEELLGLGRDGLGLGCGFRGSLSLRLGQDRDLRKERLVSWLLPKREKRPRARKTSAERNRNALSI